MPSSPKELTVCLGLTPYRIFKLAIFAVGILCAANTSMLGQYFRLPHSGVFAKASSADGAPMPAVEKAQAISRTAAEQGEPFLEQASRFERDTLRLNDEKFDFSQDWWKYCIMLLVTSVSLFFITKAGAALLRFFCMVFCVAFSTFAAYLLGPVLAPLVADHAPALDMEACPALYWSYLGVFVVAYILASIFVMMMKKPLKPAPKPKE